MVFMCVTLETQPYAGRRGSDATKPEHTTIQNNWPHRA